MWLRFFGGEEIFFISWFIPANYNSYLEWISSQTWSTLKNVSQFTQHFYMLSSGDQIEIYRFYLGNLLIYVTHCHTVLCVVCCVIYDLICNIGFASAVVICFRKISPKICISSKTTNKCFVKYSYMKIQSAIQNRYSVILLSFYPCKFFFFNYPAGGCRKLVRITAMCARWLTLSWLSAPAFHATQ